MYLQTLATAFPESSLTQAECWNLLRQTADFARLRRGSQALLERVLLGDSGIAERQFAAGDPAVIASRDAEGLARHFERSAPHLASGALEAACKRGGVDPAEIDVLIVCTCTGYLCPGLSSHVAERFGLRSDVFLQDLTGLGCGAAVPMLEAARCIAAARPDALVATVAVEVCSAAFYLDDDPGVLISACLFGDGAAAALWRGSGSSGQYRMEGFQTLHLPAEREKIRFVNAGGRLRNQLDRSVPELAAAAVSKLLGEAGEVDAVLSHTGGREVIDAIEERTGRRPLTETRDVLRRHGNVSSPCVMAALETYLAAGGQGRRLWMTAFGAGFAAHACTLVLEG